MIATVEVAGPFKFESKPHTITVEGKSQFAAIVDTPRTRTIGPSSSVREKPVTLKNWTLVLVVVSVVGVMAVAVVAITVVAVVLITHKKKATA